MASVYFNPAAGGDGTTVTDDSSPTTGLANGGHRTRFVPALSQTVAVAATAVTKAFEAAASATSALNAPGTNATSVTSLAVGLGSKSLTLAQTGKAFVVGQYVQIVSTASTDNWMVGAVTAFTTGTGAMTVNVTNSGGTGTIAAWVVVPSNPPELPSESGNAGKFLKTDGSTPSWGIPGLVLRSARTSNTILAVADQAALIDITSGSFSQTFTAAATLGNGWWCYIRNSGTGQITLDPNASETIDGLTTFIMYPGETRLVQCDGTALNSVVVNPFYATFTSSGTFTKPPGYKQFSGLLWGGGGGGATGVGGGGGACTPFNLDEPSVTASVSFTIAAASAAGGQGNDSTFLTVKGYGGGGSTASTQAGGGGGAISAGASTGTGGLPGLATNTAATKHNNGFGGGGGLNTAGVGGSSGFGGAGGGNAAAGGQSHYGGGGGGTLAGTSKFGGAGGASGVSGTAPGGGGGAGATTGARGELRIWGIV